MSVKTMINRPIIGWKEWCALPKLEIPAIKAKIDTGAKLSALHADSIDAYVRNKQQYVRFEVHPIQRNSDCIIVCHAKVFEQRHITSSTGHKELRYVIVTPCILGKQELEIMVSLTNRATLSYRFLLGRDALPKHILVDPKKGFYLGSIQKQQLNALYDN